MLPSIWKANINDIEYGLSDTALLYEYAFCYTDRLLCLLVYLSYAKTNLLVSRRPWGETDKHGHLPRGEKKQYQRIQSLYTCYSYAYEHSSMEHLSLSLSHSQET